RAASASRLASVRIRSACCATDRPAISAPLRSVRRPTIKKTAPAMTTPPMTAIKRPRSIVIYLSPAAARRGALAAACLVQRDGLRVTGDADRVTASRVTRHTSHLLSSRTYDFCSAEAIEPDPREALLAGGIRRARSADRAVRRWAISRWDCRDWNSSSVIARAARMAAFCVSTIGPAEATSFRAWSTCSATALVYSGGRSDRSVYSSAPIVTLTTDFLLTEPRARSPA